MKFSIFFSIMAMAGIWYTIKITDSPAKSANQPPAPLLPSLPDATIPSSRPPLVGNNSVPKASFLPSAASNIPAVTNLPPTKLSVSNKPTTAVLPLPQVSPKFSQNHPNTFILKPKEIRIDSTTAGILNGLMSAIVSQESNGDASLKHPVSGALGMGQVLPSNLPEWTTETFGQQVTPEQFLGNRDIQYYVIRQKLLQYYLRAIKASDGDLYLAIRRVGAQWYSGQAHLYESTKPVATGPSVQKYTYDVLGRFQNFYPQNYTLRY